ncbi:hypothetical protein [Hyphomicrobium sp. 802]|uniref:hypothetical protein n=1 Tax=Hyphomicrobium sp. 802 TaxID=1112272 RepID=UPI00045EB8A1|nr:hypothetical protein [Hyphomicrobium sp. 802]
MATDKLEVGEGTSGKFVATNTITEDSVTKHIERVSLNEADGSAVRFRSSTPSLTSVAAATANRQILAANAARVGSMIMNESTATLYLALATAASLTAYTVQIPPGGYYETPFGYQGAIYGIWSAANGYARVTELT